jgi:hypothetical protein
MLRTAYQRGSWVGSRGSNEDRRPMRKPYRRTARGVHPVVRIAQYCTALIYRQKNKP